uniref:Peptidase S1 domain-containing protein n=1 Tax=Pundamilia nyererei TaxID=303518 RepID=A0A3B4HB15_9CICH
KRGEKCDLVFLFLNEVWTANATGRGGNLTDSGGAGGSEMQPRVVGGSLERRGGSPWQVLIHRSDGFGFCGGTLVSDRWVVSAAHCFEESADHITIGEAGGLQWTSPTVSGRAAGVLM